MYSIDLRIRRRPLVLWGRVVVRARDIELDASGNIFILMFNGFLSVMKLASMGNQIWVDIVSGSLTLNSGGN